jgi:hypothetical protein
MKAPPFTRQNAREMQARATAARNARRAARRNASTPQEQLDLRSGTTLAQIDVIDRLLAQPVDVETLCSLVAAKDRLWSMVLPKAGVMRPRQSSRRGAGPASLPPPVPEW